MHDKIYLNKEEQYHREDGPVIDGDYVEEWYINGKLHRKGGPARIWKGYLREWYINGKKHREDGPAREYDNGMKEWYINGKYHREDGPAIEYSNGAKAWCYNGKCIGSSWNGFTQEDFERYLRSLKIKEYW